MLIFVLLLLVWQLLLRTTHYLPHAMVCSLSLVQCQLYLPYFAFGVVLNSYIKIFSNQWILIVSCLLWSLSPMLQFHYFFHILSVLAAVFAIMCMIVVFDKQQGPIKNMMCYLGQNTLYIYLSLFFDTINEFFICRGMVK